MAKTIVVQIGNSDDKLKQLEWSMYCEEFCNTMKNWCEEIHFTGNSDGREPWQNMCIVGVVATRTEQIGLMEALISIRKRWHQDSIAITIGSTSLM